MGTATTLDGSDRQNINDCVQTMAQLRIFVECEFEEYWTKEEYNKNFNLTNHRDASCHRPYGPYVQNPDQNVDQTSRPLHQ